MLIIITFARQLALGSYACFYTRPASLLLLLVITMLLQ
jgi:hypothetical protein